jgi:hypothetical protein
MLPEILPGIKIENSATGSTLPRNAPANVFHPSRQRSPPQTLRSCPSLMPEHAQ